MAVRSNSSRMLFFSCSMRLPEPPAILLREWGVVGGIPKDSLRELYGDWMMLLVTRSVDSGSGIWYSWYISWTYRSNRPLSSRTSVKRVSSPRLNRANPLHMTLSMLRLIAVSRLAPACGISRGSVCCIGQFNSKIYAQDDPPDQPPRQSKEAVLPHKPSQHGHLAHQSDQNHLVQGNLLVEGGSCLPPQKNCRGLPVDTSALEIQ